MTQNPVTSAVPIADGVLHLDCAAHTYGVLLEAASADPRVLGDHWLYEWSGDGAGWPPARLRTSSCTHPETIERWYGLREEAVCHEGPEQTCAYVSKKVAQGGPVVVSLDLFRWNRSAFFELDHYPHRVVVTAAEPGRFFVLDSLGPGAFAGWVPCEQVAMAVQTPELSRADLWGFDASNLTITLDRPAGGARPAEPSAPAVRDRLAQTAGTHLASGDTVLRSLGKQLTEFGQDTDPVHEELFLPGVAFLGALTTQRYLNARFAEMADSRTGADLGASAAALHRAARAWNQAYVHFLFGRRRGHPLRNLVLRLADRVSAIADLELVAAEQMAAALGV